MDGKGHKTFAPIIGCGVSTLLATNNMIPLVGNVLTTVLIATICSTLTATLPDADLVALKPKPIIKGTAKKRYSKKYRKEYYYINVSEETFRKKYHNKYKNDDAKIEPGGKGVYIYYDKCGTNNPAMKWMALGFKSMGIQKHRGWQSHSPVLWVPLWMVLAYILYGVMDIGLYLGTICLGLGLGWISHLIGDLFTLDGLPLIPKFWKSKRRDGSREEVKIAPLKGIKIGNHRLFKLGFARASNKVWIGIVCFVFVNLFLKILMPELFDSIWIGENSLFGEIYSIVTKVFGWLIDFILTILGKRD